LSISAGETLSLAVLFAGFSSGKNQSSAGTWSFVLLRVQDALVESTNNSWALGLESFHLFTDVSIMGSNWNSLAGCFWSNNSSFLSDSDSSSLSLSDHSLADLFISGSSRAKIEIISWEFTGAAVFKVLIGIVSTLGFSITKLSFVDALTVSALELISITLWLFWSLGASLEFSSLHALLVTVEVLGGEVHPSFVSDLKFPRGHAVAAEIGTEDFQD
jgi:hypothetical protein